MAGAGVVCRPAPAPNVEPFEPDPLRRRVHRALARLPHDERTLIELVYWSELSQTEIAVRLRIPPRVVKARTRAALSSLATALEATGGDLLPSGPSGPQAA
jgi:RNA polymerase sigma factor (sigma-70 family)